MRKHLLPLHAALILTLLSACNPMGGAESKVEGGHNPGLPDQSGGSGGGSGSGGSSNSAPVATNLSITTNENTAASSTLPATDSNSDTLTFSVLTNPSHGTVSITNGTTGAFTYTPTASYTGADSFDFKASDGKADSNTATVSITVNNVVTGSAPVAANISPAGFNEDTQSGLITLSYTDADSDLATTCTISNLSHVTVTQACSCSGAGVCTLKVTGSSNYNGAASFDYTVTSAGDVSNTASATLTITAVNDTPTATAISISATEDIAYTSNGTTRPHLSGNDVDGDSLTCAKATDPSHGTITVNNDCSFTYTPTANYSGSDSFTFTVNDGTVSSAAGAASITVNAVNDAPTATALSFTTSEDTAYTSNGTTRPHLSGSDVDGDTLTCAKATDPSHGTITVNSNCSFTYTPSSNYNGADSFTFTVNDGTATSAAAAATITVSAVNDAPTATALSFSTNEDTAYTSNGTTRPHLSGSDVESDPLTCAKVADPSHGTVTVNSDCSFTYAPSSNYSGSDSFTFKVNDGTSDSTAATASITVGAVNDAPTATALSFTTNEDTAYTSNGTTRPNLSGTDPDGDSLTCEKVTDPSHGTITVNSNCTFTYTPTANYNGADSYTFRVNDGTATSAAATVSITVSAVNDTPSASAVSFNTNEDTAYTSNGTTRPHLSGSDVDGDSLTCAKATDPSHGTISVNSDCSFTYTPTGNYNGADSFTFIVNDGTVSSAAATASITVDAVNDTPTLTTISTLATATEDTAFTISYTTLAGAADEADADGDAISFRVEAVSTGTLTKGGVAVTPGTTLLSSGESLVWTPAANANGTLNAFTVKAWDGTAASSSAIQVQVTTTAVNDAPTISDIADTSTNEDTATGAIAFTVGDVETATASLTVTASSSNTTLVPNLNIALGGAGANRTINITPASNQFGTSTITVTVDDGTTTTNDTFVLTVNSVNDTPTLTSISTLATATEDTAFTISYATLAAAADEADADGDAISFRVEAVSTGTLTKGGVAVTPGTTLLSSGESLVWIPAANANGTLNAFTVKAWDGTAASSSAFQVQVTTTAVNDTPVATAQSISTNMSTTYTSNGTTKPHLAGTDAEGSALACAVGTAASHGTATVNADCSFSYAPTAAYTGSDSFTFTVNDGSLTSAASTVSIAVSGDLIDDDNSATGFAGGTKVGVQWNTNSINKLILGPDTDCDGNMSEGETVYTNCAELDSSWTPQWSSLVSYWKMNESSWNGTANEVVDSKGANHGTSISSATTTSPSKMGPYAGSFDGANKHVKVSDSTTLRIDAATTANWSIGAWIYPTAFTSYSNIFAYGFRGATLGIYAPTSKFSSWTNSASTIYSSASVSTNEWTHIVLVNSNTNRSFYINGVLDSTQTVPAVNTLSGASGTVGIGTILNAGNLWNTISSFNGKIDELAVWHTALTSNEIDRIYSRQSAKYSGQFTSRVMNYGSSIAWDGLKWLTTLPFGKELTGDANASGSISAADSESSTDYPSLVGSTGSTSDDNLMNGLLGLWHMNETSWSGSAGEVVDSSGNSQHASAQGGISTHQSGLYGRAGRFQGSGTYVKTASTTSLNPANAISLQAWVFETGANANNGILNKSTLSWDQGDYALIIASNVVYFRLNNAAASAALNGPVVGAWRYGNWNHIVATYDKSNMYVYVNGVASSPTAYTTAITSSNTPFHIGAYYGSPYAFNGLIDEVAIWSRALHADEVKQLYRRGANRLKFQVRTCTAADCSDNPTWLGNDNTNGSYFSELHNYAPYNYDINNCSATNLILTGSPSLLFDCFTGALSNLTSQQYFQYRTILESDDTSTNCNYGSGATWCSPELKSVEIKP